MQAKTNAHKLSVVSSYLVVAFIYLLVFVPIFFIASNSLLLKTVHITDLFVCAWAAFYLKKTKKVGPPSVALCIIAYTTVVAVTITGGYANSGPYLVFPYAPFVAFLNDRRQSGFNWLLAMLITLCGLLALDMLDLLPLSMPPATFALYTFIYLLTILLLSSYMKLKELADNEVVQKSLTLNRSNRKLKQLNEAKDNFILLASHQLRTPATGVKQYLGMLLDGYIGKLTKKQYEFVSIGYESNERQLRIVNDLLQVARVDAGKVKLRKQLTDIVAMVQNVIAEQRPIFEGRKQTITLHRRDRIPPINADRDRLRMAIGNVIDNAGKYTFPGKSIDVIVKRHKNTISVAVIDSGVGIDSKDRTKLFKKFSRIDNSLSVEVGGSGLGLYWAKKITELHKGKLVVRSKKGHGSTFEFILPAE